MHRLIVAIPGYKGKHDVWRTLIDRLERDSGADVLRFRYDIDSARRLAIALGARIEEECRQKDYDEIILIGHSFGTLLCRQAYLLAAGAEPMPPQTGRWTWGERVSRLVLFAAVSRGMDWENGSFKIRLANRIVLLLPTKAAQAWRDAATGSAFLTNLRIHWIRHFDAAQKTGAPVPSIVQFRGTDDAYVNFDDTVDIERFDRTVYINLSGAGHTSLVQLEAAENPEARYTFLRDCILSETPTEIDSGATVQDRVIEGADRVVFLTHGIRASGYEWPTAATKIIRERYPSVVPVIITQGFFSALRFALPGSRRRNLRFFRDEYTKALAENPQARFDYIGHSNGTYLLGHNLDLVRGMSFDSVVLAASVLPISYDWSARLKAGQVRRLRSDSAAADLPVGVLCELLSRFGMEDVGTGGFTGFNDWPSSFDRVGWYDGGHSAMLTPDNLPHLLDYALGDAPEATVADPKVILDHPKGWVARLGRLAVPLLVLLLGALIVFAVWGPGPDLVRAAVVAGIVGVIAAALEFY